jgi:hypothetical protein
VSAIEAISVAEDRVQSVSSELGKKEYWNFGGLCWHEETTSSD